MFVIYRFDLIVMSRGVVCDHSVSLGSLLICRSSSQWYHLVCIYVYIIVHIRMMGAGFELHPYFSSSCIVTFVYYYAIKREVNRKLM